MTDRKSESAKQPRLGVVGLPGKWSTETLADAVEAKTGERLVIDLERVSMDFAHGRCEYMGQDLRELDGVLVKKIDHVYGPKTLDRLEILHHLQSSGVRVFSRPERVGRLINRLSCTTALRAAGVPMPDTCVTEDIELACQAVLGFGAAVLKPLYSTKARGMRVVESANESDIRRELEEFRAEGNSMMYVQRRVDMPDRDLGIVFVGDRYLATYARVGAVGSWNTTTHSGGRYSKGEASPQVFEIARRARDVFDLDFTVVDVVDSKDGMFVFEVSAFGGFRGVHEACGIDAAAAYVEHALEEVAS